MTIPERDEIIRFDRVFLSRNGKPILSGLNLRVLKDEKLIIQGKSGIGKSTLFKVLLGFEGIDKGTVTFTGHGIEKNRIRQIREMIFYLSQDIDFKNARVGYLLDEIMACNPPKKQDNSGTNRNISGDISEIFTFLDLPSDIVDQQVKDLSGGERQRIGLALCFLLDRPVWLLDEPTSALDEAMKLKVVDYVLDKEKTIVIISHDDVWEKDNRTRIERWV